ncbi:MAG: DUF721 domain-containing protein [Gammaproteobacteria bacterium]|nr:DUF721 domain-containing protein [Gammaproteobacteria bacterium]MCP5199380.1 DUF721 domain-containing protein [Gammaproteobacteria bacterium]
MKAPTQVGRIVSAFGHLKQLTARAARVAELEKELQSLLPPALAAQVRLATIENGSLVLFAASPAWAAKLRYATPQLLAALPRRAEFAEVRSIRVRVEPRESTAPGERRPERAHMSAAAGRDIRAQAESLDDDNLRAALRRLARRAD